MVLFGELRANDLARVVGASGDLQLSVGDDASDFMQRDDLAIHHHGDPRAEM